MEKNDSTNLLTLNLDSIRQGPLLHKLSVTDSTYQTRLSDPVACSYGSRFVNLTEYLDLQAKKHTQKSNTCFKNYFPDISLRKNSKPSLQPVFINKQKRRRAWDQSFKSQLPTKENKDLKLFQLLNIKEKPARVEPFRTHEKYFKQRKPKLIKTKIDQSSKSIRAEQREQRRRPDARTETRLRLLELELKYCRIINQSSKSLQKMNKQQLTQFFDRTVVVGNYQDSEL